MKKNLIFIFGGIFILVAIFYFVFATGGNQTQPVVKIASYQSTDKEKPKAKLETISFDLKDMKVSDQKAHDFTIENQGGKPLQLFGVSSSCGCTVGKIIINGKESQEFGMHAQSDSIFEVQKGQKAMVRVIYRPYVMPVYGPVEREVYVQTNDPENPRLTFKVNAYVK